VYSQNSAINIVTGAIDAILSALNGKSPLKKGAS
jgi:hypothetical protein